jgi:hypothetical protein
MRNFIRGNRQLLFDGFEHGDTIFRAMHPRQTYNRSDDALEVMRKNWYADQTCHLLVSWPTFVCFTSRAELRPLARGIGLEPLLEARKK